MWRSDSLDRAAAAAARIAAPGARLSHPSARPPARGRSHHAEGKYLAAQGLPSLGKDAWWGEGIDQDGFPPNRMVGELGGEYGSCLQHQDLLKGVEANLVLTEAMPQALGPLH